MKRIEFNQGITEIIQAVDDGLRTVDWGVETAMELYDKLVSHVTLTIPAGTLQEGDQVTLDGRGITVVKPELNLEESKWISVDEKKPKPYESVLVCADGKVKIGFYDSEYKRLAVSTPSQFNQAPVTYWQPLPPPPQNEKGQGE